MRALIVTLLVACGDPPVTDPDAAPAPDSAVRDSFRVPVGAACDARQTSLCDFGFGWCHEGVCRAQCRSPPMCAAGTTQTIVTVSQTESVCVCLPE